MARVYPFNNGVLMLRNISAPFLNALEDKPLLDIEGLLSWKLLTFHRGKNGFCHFHSFHVHKKNAHSWTYWRKKEAPRNWTQQHIYIYTHTHTPDCWEKNREGAAEHLLENLEIFDLRLFRDPSERRPFRKDLLVRSRARLEFLQMVSKATAGDATSMFCSFSPFFSAGVGHMLLPDRKQKALTSAAIRHQDKVERMKRRNVSAEAKRTVFQSEKR